MSSDAATPATPAADDQVPAPRSGDGSVAVPVARSERPGEDRTNGSANGTTPAVTDEAADTAEPVDEPSHEATDEPADQAADEPSDQAAEEPADEPSGQGTDEPADQATDEALDGSAEEPALEATDESADEAAEVPAPRAAADPPTGGRLTARLREARARLDPERPVVPAPRSPEGVVPPPDFGRGSGAPRADLVRAVDALTLALAELEQDPEEPERRALVRVVELSAAGVPDAGWSTEERIDTEALAGAAELAGALHDATSAVLERLDAEERAAPAVEVDAVATALQVARMVLDLEGFARHGR